MTTLHPTKGWQGKGLRSRGTNCRRVLPKCPAPVRTKKDKPRRVFGIAGAGLAMAAAAAGLAGRP